MKLAALLLLPAIALADPAPEPPVGHPHIVLKKGELAPAGGVFADSEAARYDLERLRWLRLELDTCVDLKPQTPAIPAWTWFAAGVLAAGVAAWKLK